MNYWTKFIFKENKMKFFSKSLEVKLDKIKIKLEKEEMNLYLNLVIRFYKTFSITCTSRLISLKYGSFFVRKIKWCSYKLCHYVLQLCWNVQNTANHYLNNYSHIPITYVHNFIYFKSPTLYPLRIIWNQNCQVLPNFKIRKYCEFLSSSKYTLLSTYYLFLFLNFRCWKSLFMNC